MTGNNMSDTNNCCSFTVEVSPTVKVPENDTELGMNIHLM